MALACANSWDAEGQGLAWWNDGSPESDPRKQNYEMRRHCYYAVITALQDCESQLNEVVNQSAQGKQSDISSKLTVYKQYSRLMLVSRGCGSSSRRAVAQSTCNTRPAVPLSSLRLVTRTKKDWSTTRGASPLFYSPPVHTHSLDRSRPTLSSHTFSANRYLSTAMIYYGNTTSGLPLSRKLLVSWPTWRRTTTKSMPLKQLVDIHD